MSSSPELPSLNEVTAKRQARPPLRSGSKAAPIPENAARSFTSAASFWRAAQGDAINADDVFAEETPGPVLETRTEKAASKTVIEISPDTSRTDGELSVRPSRRATTPSPSKHRAEEVDGLQGEDLPPDSKPWRKYKSPKRAPESQPTISITKVTKPAAKGVTRKQEAETISRHFANEAPARQSTSRPRTPEPIQSEPAHQRRMDWTPPRADTINLLSDSSEAPLSVSKDVFKNLQNAYGCKEVAKEPKPPKNEELANVLGKRKLIETVMIHSGSTSSKEASREPSPVKSKAPKKKQRTITELATAAYAIPEQVEASGPSKDDSLLRYFGSETALHQPSGDAAAPVPKKRASRAKAKKAAPQIVLLSPESAMRESARQDFVFGTSSQLAREHSPSLLRDLHMAMQASNTIDDPFASSPPVTSETRERARSNLWSVGARDADGELLEVEVIDLVQSPVATHPEAILNPWKDLPRAVAGSTASAKETTVLHLPSSQDSSGLPLTRSNFFSTQREPEVAIDYEEPATSRLVAPSTALSATIELADQPPPSNQEVEREQHQPVSSSRREVPRPNFELYTDAQLAGKIASYGFKPVKKRTAMIALLDRCWGSKNQSASSAVASAASAGLSTSAAASARRAKSPPSTTKTGAANPKGRPRKGSTVVALATAPATTNEPAGRPRGRPRKGSALAAKATASPKPKLAAAAKGTAKEPMAAVATPKRRKAATQPAIEIADTDSECGPLSPSSPCSSPADRVFSSPLAVDMSITEGDTELTLNTSPTDQQAALFAYITQAVTTAPQTTDPANPSWHEKMLMYDPVVLEDLTAWLNAGQLTRVGYAEEVSPADVKRWCESKSVCCLWRATFKGKERKRF